MIDRQPTLVQELEDCQVDNLNHWHGDDPPSWKELFIVARRIDAIEAKLNPPPPPEPEFNPYDENYE
jgi:hypothetical protein